MATFKVHLHMSTEQLALIHKALEHYQDCDEGRFEDDITGETTEELRFLTNVFNPEHLDSEADNGLMTGEVLNGLVL